MVSIPQLVIFNNTQTCLQSVDFYCLMPKVRVKEVGDRKEGQVGVVRRLNSFSVRLACKACPIGPPRGRQPPTRDLSGSCQKHQPGMVAPGVLGK